MFRLNARAVDACRGMFGWTAKRHRCRAGTRKSSAVDRAMAQDQRPRNRCAYARQRQGPVAQANRSTGWRRRSRRCNRYRVVEVELGRSLTAIRTRDPHPDRIAINDIRTAVDDRWLLGRYGLEVRRAEAVA